MSYPINYPTPQGANVQIFRSGGNETILARDWVKPQGASFVWFTLIGSGGGGGGGYVNDADPDFPVYARGGGGASGGVTNFMCPAFLLPDVLQVAVGAGGDGGAAGSYPGASSNGVNGQTTAVYYQQKAGNGYVIVQAFGGGGGGGTSGTNGAAGAATTTSVLTPMLAAGFHNATNGQNGAVGGTAITTNDITFVMGGSGQDITTDTITGYYGYTARGRSGYSQLSPIPLAIPTTTGSNRLSNGFGCGGNGGGSVTGSFTGTLSNGGRGGDGLAIIVTW